jgi:hypothetical protein
MFRYVAISLCHDVQSDSETTSSYPTDTRERVISQGIKRLKRESDHSLRSVAKAKNTWNFASSPLIRLHSVALMRRDSFTFYFTL